jgi:hypothetical protein
MIAEDTVEVVEIFTRKKWFRRIGNGLMEEVDLLPFGGVVPLLFLDNTIDWVEQTQLWERSKWLKYS